MSDHLKLDNYKRPKLQMPEEGSDLLLHSCCAPCAGEIMEALAASDIKTTVYFYNPNIHPKEEYEIRKNENRRFCEKLGFECIDADYDKDNWFERIKGLEDEPERGERCTKCFDMRFERSALYAKENNFSVYATTLGISRWKDMNQINSAGHRAADRYEDVVYWDFNWRKQGGSSRMIEISKREEFYQQEDMDESYDEYDHLADEDLDLDEIRETVDEMADRFAGSRDLFRGLEKSVARHNEDECDDCIAKSLKKLRRYAKLRRMDEEERDDFFEVANRFNVPGQHALDGAVGSHWHKSRCRDTAAIKGQLTASSLAIPGLDIKFHSWPNLHICCQG